LSTVHDAHPPITAVREAVARALAEDLTPIGDLTSALLPPDLEATALFVPRADGVLAGRLCADEAIRQVDDTLAVSWSADDGDRITAGTEIGRVAGRLSPILTAERTALNFLGHLSGVATLTARFVDAVAAAGGTLRVWDTRKTTPGLRPLEKAAVRAGGGANHRGSLSDWVLLKDNHLELFGIAEAVARSRDRWPGRTVHVECGDLDQVREAVAAGADALLLDNMTPDEVRAVVAEVRAVDPRRPLLEVSGNVTLETIASYATTGADMVSIGALTHSAPVLDIGLDVVSD
jgi:nicotinate-nucleotide pyrophosphorylase (carboxylating)